MKVKLMAFFDQASAAYLPPFVVASPAVAIRELVQLPEKQPQHDFVRFSDQYTLFELGSFDNETGLIESAMGPQSLGTCQALMARR